MAFPKSIISCGAFALHISFLIIVSSCGNDKNVSLESSLTKEIEFFRIECEKDRELLEQATYYPFRADTYMTEEGKEYSVSITSASWACYFEILAKHGVYGNGPGWEGVVVQVIEKDLPELKGLLKYESEADACLIYPPSDEVQDKIAEHLHNIFTDESKLKEHLEKLDLSRIDA